MKFIVYNIFLGVIIFFQSCSNHHNNKQSPLPDPHTIKENMIIQNKEWHILEDESVEAYVRRKQLNVITTGTGLRYKIYKISDTTKPTANTGDLVTLNYSIYLLENDSLCYSSEGVPETFMVNFDNVESGLHEAMGYLREGEKAKIILPSYLAFGLIGDLDKIPPQSSLLYDVEIIKITKPQK
jgi:FKBP-type peptidyl-prolyl cis-trans isomerase